MRSANGDHAHRRDPSPDQDHLGRSVVLHLLPGVVITAFYVLFAPLAITWGFPPVFALLVAVPLVLVPLELGYLLYRAQRSTGTFSLVGVVGYREKLSLPKFTLLTLGLFVWSTGVLGVFSRFESDIVALFGWLPEWLTDPVPIEEIASSSTGVLVVLFVFGFAFNGLVGPIVEELYFRGHLLPRIDRLGRWAPVLNVVLFSLYHLWSPWQNPARILALLPLVYVTWRMRNIYLAMTVHVATNMGGMIGWLLAVILS